jgi:hypothetical protein
MPADISRVAALGLADLAPVAPHIHFLIPFVLMVVTWRCMVLSLPLPMAPIPLEDVRHSFFSPLLFFRPPPFHV